MGSENDKRLSKSTLVSNNQNNQNNQNNNTPSSNQRPQTQNNMNLNNPQNERINPYDQSKKIQNNANRPNPGPSPGQKNQNMGGFYRSMTQKRNTITDKMLKQAFDNYSIDHSYLNKKGFNDAIESIFRFNIPEVHYTHLSDKIYDLLDSSHDGKIQEDEFVDGFKKVLKERNFRLLLSMMAMMSLPDIYRDYIEIKEIKQFFYLSYVEGFKHLIHQIKKNKVEFERNNLPVPSCQQIGKWAKKFEKEIGIAIDKDLREFDPNVTTRITFEQFLRWISIDHDLKLKYGTKTITIATSLLRLDDINYDEGKPGETRGPYPSI